MSNAELNYYQNVFSQTGDEDPGLENIFSRFFDRTATKFRDARRSLTNMRPKDTILMNRQAFLKLVAKVDYMDMAGISVPTPEGLVVDYRTLSAYLLEGVEHIKTLEEELLAPFKNLLASAISSKSALYNADPVRNSVKERSAKLKTVESKIRSCFDNRGKSYSPYSQVVERNADWPDVLDVVQSLGRFGGVDPTYISGEVDICATYIDHLVTMIKNKEIEGLNPNIQRQLVDMAAAVAEEVSFISTCFYFNEASFTAIDDMMRQVIKNLQ